jgi:hypothetical protein
MSKMGSLIKTQLNMNFGISALKYRFTKEKKKRWEPILIAFAILIGLGPLLVAYFFLMSGLFVAGMTLSNPQPEIILTIAFLATQAVVLFFGMFYIMGSFYFSHDLDTLVPLPLKPYEVIGSKFIVVMINEYLTALPILLPPLLIYGIGMGQGLLYWIKGLLLVLAAPVIPLTIGAVIIMLIMRVINLRRNKDILAIIGGFAGLALALGFNFFIQSIPKNAGKDFLKNMLESQSGVINAIGRKFPPSIWATFGLSKNNLEGWGNFALFIIVSLLLLAVLLWLSNLVFYKALLAGQEVARKRKTLTSDDLNRQYGAVSSPVTAIIKREWKLLLRTPIYAINGLTGAIMGPFIVLILFFAKGSDADAQQLMGFISNPEYAKYIALGGLGLMLFTSGMNLVASTSVSREGSTLWILKMIPVSVKNQVLGKFLQSYMVSILGVLTTGIVLGVFLKLSPARLLAVIVIGFLASVSFTALNLLLDVFHPKLTWNSEQEAMKQNLNGGLGMLVSVLVLAILAAVTVMIIMSGVNEWAVYGILGVVSVVIGILSMLALFAVAEKKYREYEA